MIELIWFGQEKRARRIRTRPEPTIIGNCDWLGLHCRQKVWRAKPKKSLEGKVASQQQKLIHRLITILGISTCTTCGWPVEQLWGIFYIPYSGLLVRPYICNRLQLASILTKVIERPTKLVLAHLYIRPPTRLKKIPLFIFSLQKPSGLEGCCGRWAP